MTERPTVMAVDVIETMFSLEPLRDRLAAVGQPAHLLELWFTRVLRDGFALAASGGYQPFARLADEALAAVSSGVLTPEERDTVLTGIGELPAHPDVLPALRLAHDSGMRVLALTNGAAATTQALLERARLERYVWRVVSVDEVRRFKPAPEVYHHAVRVGGATPQRTALVAAHAWDVHGAHHAGLATGWVNRAKAPMSEVFAVPDVCTSGLDEAVARLLGRPGPAQARAGVENR
ncbi:haloacid dehalogenase type II [Lipingzhangella sp. LS1_29]|uniref:Haloacid dehalogenase type II n=1 Tax=Lipingzhangella rawalii TaxID=2055835 RepID=A0ABU2H971_9ACTN|nr:haloacid dehalogenase type II [Lipingzhangella rawalii]MDS1271855.1 haloacid dehalogenase type II [Lipingzhangella rawalii]